MEIVLIYDDLGFADYYNIPQYVYFFHKPQKRTKEFFSPLSFDFSLLSSHLLLLLSLHLFQTFLEIRFLDRFFLSFFNLLA